MPTIRFTYHTITPESAKQGDFADHGFWCDGYKYSLCDEDQDLRVKESQEGVYDWTASLGDALREARGLGIYQYSNPGEPDSNHGWWSSVDPDQDYSTGENTYYSLHIEGVTLSTRKRIHRWLNGQKVIPLKKKSILNVNPA